jgi:membrane-bound serine protease (ClpP class)
MRPVLPTLQRLLSQLLLLGLGLLLAAACSAAQLVMVIPITGAIGPARADFVVRHLAQAQQKQAQLVVLQMDTPGGLDTSMRQIIQAILASPVPVASYVAPSGARAASAGTYILYASHIAAMAPGTNLGAATPVEIGVGGGDAPSGKGEASQGESAMKKKMVNDAAAYIRGLAQLRGRNAAWAERAVREAVSLSANEALAQKVSEYTARDVPDLLKQLDGRTITTSAGIRTLHSAAAPIEVLQPDWRERLLATITDPSIALILMMVGMYGLFFEFSNPGFVLPGVVGAICLLLGLFGLQLLPINYTGLALILLGIALLLAEAFVPSFGTLGLGGIVAFSIGALMLIDAGAPGFGIPLSLIVTLALLSAGFVFAVSSFALKARRRPVVSGDSLAGSVGVMLEDLAPSQPEGWASIQGEQWRVRCATPLKQGEPVRVTGHDGLTLVVTPLNHEQGAQP